VSDHDYPSSSSEDEFDEVRRAADAARQSSQDPESSIWDEDDAIASLRMERSVQGDESPESMAKRLLAQAAPLAAGKIIHIAMHSTNDNTAFAAAKYITDLQFEGTTGTGKDVWEKILGDAVSKLEVHANAGSGSE
jgi:hypothetical protein